MVRNNYLKIRTKNYSCKDLIKNIKINNNNKKAVFRLGSKTPLDKIFSERILNTKEIIEINTINSCINSSNKLLMKQCFNNLNVNTADWYRIKYNNNSYEIYDGIFKELNTSIEDEKIKYPLVCKHIKGSKGRGNYKIENKEELIDWLDNHRNTLNNYIFEKFYTYTKEYRIHVTENEYFYTCRKMLKNDCPEHLRWQRHDDNCVWILEDNPLFNKPNNWDEIILHCINSLKSVGLTIGACDVKLQSTIDNPKFIILEINSAPSMGEITLIKYKEILNKILNE